MISELDAKSSILFLGSGFSRGAKNILGECLPVGDELRDKLANSVGVDPRPYDLRTIADAVAARRSTSLLQILYETFTAKDLASYQRDILALPWRRIYTTNYDDVIELSLHEAKRAINSYNYDDAKPARLAQGSVIHLHGMIRKANEHNVLDQLVLNERSYVRQFFDRSPWYDEFARDVKFSSQIFFVGYSLNDYHITSLLMQDNSAAKRTYFVTRAPDAIFDEKVVHYGSVLPIGCERFAELCRTLPSRAAISDLTKLRAFRLLDPYKDKRTLAPPTALEVLNLLAFGKFEYKRALAALPGANYIVPRERLVEEAATKLHDSRCLLVHSRLGNGKSIFLYALAAKLIANDYTCFLCDPDPMAVAAEIDAIKHIKKGAILFDSYDAAVDVIPLLGELSDQWRFIVAVRTSVQEVRLHEIRDKFPEPIERVSLNTINATDRAHFGTIIDKAGLRTHNFKATLVKSRDIRELVLSLYDNALIKTALEAVLLPLLSDDSFKKVFIASHLLDLIGQPPQAGFLHSVTGLDAYAEMARFREITGDMFVLDDDAFRVRSAVFSQYLVQHYFNSRDVIESIFAMITQAVQRRREHRYRAILSSFMRYSFLSDILRNEPRNRQMVEALYERLRDDAGVNAEPLFWLQYAILAQAIPNLLAAEGFIETSYARAAMLPGYETFQIDTQALRLYLSIEEKAVNSPRVTRFHRIKQLLSMSLIMLSNSSHRAYAIRVLDDVEPFVRARIGALSDEEMIQLTYLLNQIIGRIDELPNFEAGSGSGEVRSSLSRAKELIVRYGHA